jgi:hypothetical protein
MDLDLGLGTGALVAVSAVGGVLGLLLSALLLRSACDLWGLDPAPSYLRCLAVTLITDLVNAPIGYGIAVGVQALHISDTATAVIAILVAVPAAAAIDTVVFLVAFRLRFAQAFMIWLIYSLFSLLVGAVIFMLLLGGATTVGAARRLF